MPDNPVSNKTLFNLLKLTLLIISILTYIEIIKFEIIKENYAPANLKIMHLSPLY